MSELQQQAEAAARDENELAIQLARKLFPKWIQPESHAQYLDAVRDIRKHIAPLEAQRLRLEEQLLAIQSASKCGTASATMIAVSNAEARVAAALQERDEARREAEDWKKRFQYNSIEISFLNDRVHRGEHSENCPFCKSYPATGHSQQVPVCQLCRLESERDQLTSDNQQLRARMAELEKVNNLIANLDWCVGYELTADTHDQLDEARDLACELQKSTPSNSLLHQQELERYKKALEWWQNHLNYEHGTDYESGDVVIFKVTGNVNDREWEEVSRGETLLEAIEAAMKGQQ